MKLFYPDCCNWDCCFSEKMAESLNAVGNFSYQYLAMTGEIRRKTVIRFQGKWVFEV